MGDVGDMALDLKQIMEYLRSYSGRPLRLMEVCGTHTAGIRSNGLLSVLSNNIRMITGPGCPVCVTVSGYIDRLIELSADSRNVIVSFGDLLRVPGSVSNLAQAKAEGADIRYVYSPLDTIRMAEEDKDHTYIFAAVGFETTVPVYTALISDIMEKDIRNIRLLTALKTMPKAIENVAGGVDGFLAPGHVAVITGTKEYEELAGKLQRPFIISGFEGEELAAAIYALVKNAERNTAVCCNLYPGAVREEGNMTAKEEMARFFEADDAVWRGLGEIPMSGLYLKDEFLGYDAGSRGLVKDAEIPGCKCAEVITGRLSPNECPLFGKACTMEHPVGACMVSQEGACFNNIRYL